MSVWLDVDVCVGFSVTLAVSVSVWLCDAVFDLVRVFVIVADRVDDLVTVGVLVSDGVRELVCEMDAD